MLSRISWPTAVVILGAIAAIVALAALHQPVPEWLLGLAPGLLVGGAMPQAVGAKTDA